MIMLSVNWPHVWMVTLLGFCLVLCLLFVLIFILQLLGFLMKEKPAKQAAASAREAVADILPKEAATAKSGDAATTAAIAMALHLFYNGIHDEEPTKVTIKKVERRYSPWNSKLYGINNLHR